jgi:pimeloyl-ACP methyl ester carboxylesterase
MPTTRCRLLMLALVTTALLTALPCLTQRQAAEGATKLTAPEPEPPAAFPFSLKEAEEIEKKIALPRLRFYDTPNPLPKGKPGDWLGSEQFAGYAFPFTPELPSREVGIKTVRFLYRSKSALERDVPASGVILIPYGKPPKDGWPVVVWAHGTSGVARRCAPSLMKDLAYSWEGLLQWALLGYAVVAPDYAGLGTNTPHEYLAAPAQAHDIIYALPAAHKAVPDLGKRWVAIGHSQGAGAVLCVAEMQNTIKDGNYLGCIALAPVGDLVPVFRQINNTAARGYVAFLAYGIKSVYPDFDPGEFLTHDALQQLPVVEQGGWFVTLATFSEKVPPSKMLKPGWDKNKQFLDFCKLSFRGDKPTSGPILLLQGEKDEAIPTSATDALHERLKKQNPDVTYKTYPDLDHDPLVFGSFRDQVRWVQERFEKAK